MLKNLWNKLTGGAKQQEGQERAEAMVKQEAAGALQKMTKVDRKEVFKMLRNPQARAQAARLMELMRKDGVDLKNEKNVQEWLQKNNERVSANEAAPAAAKTAPVVRHAPKIGRNDPCLCGSGKKYKKCCALKNS